MRDFTTLVLYITVRKVVVPAPTTGPGLRVLRVRLVPHLGKLLKWFWLRGIFCYSTNRILRYKLQVMLIVVYNAEIV